MRETRAAVVRVRDAPGPPFVRRCKRERGAMSGVATVRSSPLSRKGREEKGASRGLPARPFEWKREEGTAVERERDCGTCPRAC